LTPETRFNPPLVGWVKQAMKGEKIEKPILLGTVPMKKEKGKIW